MKLPKSLVLGAVITVALACDSCYGPTAQDIHVRNVRRMQPGAQNATTMPKGPLEWGQINFLHTTDTHGWLEGHIKEQNYGADWGDFASFSQHMRHKAGSLGVDLLIIDTGDLHDGNGDSDATNPNGVLSNPIHQHIEYDILTIGNHELYVTEIAYETFANYSAHWGEKYLTSNVQIFNPATNAFEYMGKQYRYFTTKHGLRIMSFGVLFDFTGNSNVSKVIPAATLVKEQWFLDAVNYDKPIDLFLLIGHNPVRTESPTFTMEFVSREIRALRPEVPLQVFGGHTHIRDFRVYDDMSTALEAGRYCETLGWLSMSGIKSSTFRSEMELRGVPNPTRPATNDSTSGLVYSRRYLDWNRLTFEYHATGSQSSTKFDLHSGLRVTKDITELRKELNLALLYGCAPTTYCISCKPFGDPGNIYTFLPTALGAMVVNKSRSTIARYIFINTGSIRYDLVKGPFTFDDSYIVSPYPNFFRYIPSVPYSLAKGVLANLNTGPAALTRSDTTSQKPIYGSMPLPNLPEECSNPLVLPSSELQIKPRSLPIARRQTILTPGYVTTDDWGNDGDDTPHSPIPSYPIPNFIQANGSFPTDGTNPDVVDIVFPNFVTDRFISLLNKLAGKTVYRAQDVGDYLPRNYTTRDYLLDYAKVYWQEGMPNCPVGGGVGFED